MKKSDNILIRPAGKADLDAVMNIESAWTTTPHWSRSHFETEVGSDRSQFYVCIRGKDILGYAAMMVIPPEAQVTTVAVRPDCARQGFGRKLMNHLHAQARRAGCTFVTLEVNETNQAALRLYEDLGYRIVGRRLKYYNNQFDALLMTNHFDVSKPVSQQQSRGH